MSVKIPSRQTALALLLFGVVSLSIGSTAQWHTYQFTTLTSYETVVSSVTTSTLQGVTTSLFATATLTTYSTSLTLKASTPPYSCWYQYLPYPGVFQASEGDVISGSFSATGKVDFYLLSTSALNQWLAGSKPCSILDAYEIQLGVNSWSFDWTVTQTGSLSFLFFNHNNFSVGVVLNAVELAGTSIVNTLYASVTQTVTYTQASTYTTGNAQIPSYPSSVWYVAVGVVVLLAVLVIALRRQRSGAVGEVEDQTRLWEGSGSTVTAEVQPCPECGAPILKGSKYCSECGMHLDYSS